MDESIIMLVFIGILIIGIAISFIISKNKKNSKSTNNKVGTTKTNSESVQKKDMSEFIKFDKIANDMIYQNKGEKYTMAIECKGINYDLMSNVEQMSVEEGFIKFLNTLKYPIQLYVQTRTVNLSDNIKKYKERVEKFDETYYEMISKYNNAEEDIDVSDEETEKLRFEKIKYGNIAEYANDITKYIEKLSLNKFMLQRKYYVLISYYKSEIVSTEKFSKQEYEEICFRELYTRAQGIISSLSACSVTGRILNSNELAELVYISYNRDDQKNMNIKRALESGFYRLYTTSPDVREQKKKMLDEQIKQEAAKRLELAIQEGIKNGTFVTQEEAEKQLDKRIDKEAINLVEESSVSAETKKVVKEAILEQRKKRLNSNLNVESEKEGTLKETSQNILEKQNSELDENEIEVVKEEPQIKTEISQEEKSGFMNYPSMSDEIMMREEMNNVQEEMNNVQEEKIINNNINQIESKDENKETKIIGSYDDENDSIV